MKAITKSRTFFSLKVIVPTIVLLLAAASAYAIIATAPKATKRRPQAVQPTVKTQIATPQAHAVWVPVMGTVTPAREITLEARVSGEVTNVSDAFVPGGYFEKGETILTIDREDYELALSEVQATVAEAEYNLKVEKGYQNVSAREWDLLKGSAKGTESESELALRKPHLAKAQANLRAAQAKLKQARLDLARTTITAPFAAMVQAKSTDLGAAITTQEGLATLVGTDEFWIEASVPVDRLDWVKIPLHNQTKGSTVRIVNNGNVRKGQVIRLLPSLEDEGRMARLLISVQDPLNIKGETGVKPLLLGSYVSIEIQGPTMANVYTVPRSAFHENNTIWVMKADNTLDIRTVSTVWRDTNTVILKEGLAPGEHLVTSNLSAPVEGMALRSMTGVLEPPAPASPQPSADKSGKSSGQGKGVNKEAANG